MTSPPTRNTRSRRPIAVLRKAYAQPGAMRAGFEVFKAFEQDAKDFAGFAQTKLSMPMLVLAGEKAGGHFLIDQGRLVDDNVDGVIINGSGHWLIDEAPDQVIPKTRRVLFELKAGGGSACADPGRPAPFPGGQTQMSPPHYPSPARSRLSFAQFQPLADLALEAAIGRIVEVLAAHLLRKIVLAGKGIGLVVIVLVALAVALFLHQLGRRVEDVLRRQQRAVLFCRRGAALKAL